MSRCVRIPRAFVTAPGPTGTPESMRSFYEPDEDDIRLLEAVGPLRPNVAALGRAAREALEDDAHERSLRSVVAAAPAPAACCSGETHRAAVQALVAGGRR